MSNLSKILVLNPAPDDLDKVLVKANLQHGKNGPFEAVILLGDVLPSKSNLPNVAMDTPAYFSEGMNGLTISIPCDHEKTSNLCDVQKNLTLAPSYVNVLTLPLGTTIMMVSGTAEAAENQKTAILEVEQCIRQVDILCTYNWPKALATQRQLTLVGNSFIDEIVKLTKPRYHFAVGHESGVFYEAAPFSWSENRYTRFIGLGQEGLGGKWFYAFTMNRLLCDSAPKTLSENPFTTECSRKRKPENSHRPQHEQELIISRPAKVAKVVAPSECFFCLSNPKAETHMVVTVGTACYVAIAKGPLTRPNLEMRFSGHGIIIPIEHRPTFRSFGDIKDSLTYPESQKYQFSLVRAFAEKFVSSKLVFFETSRDTSVHQGIQFLPVPTHLIANFDKSLNAKVETNNDKFPNNHPLDFVQFTSLQDPDLLEIIQKHDYVSFTVFDTVTSVRVYISKLEDPNKVVDFQFARRVLAHVLRCPQRVYWSKCQQPQVKEAADCDNSKEFFEPYDLVS